MFKIFCAIFCSVNISADVQFPSLNISSRQIGRFTPDGLPDTTVPNYMGLGLTVGLHCVVCQLKTKQNTNKQNIYSQISGITYNSQCKCK